jgi:hypothetical protein
MGRVKRLLLGVAIVALGCGGGSKARVEERTDQRYSGDAATRVLDWGDIEKYRGTLVNVEGRFAHIKGEHGIVTLDSGLDVYIPNIHLYLRGRAWFDYVGKRVSANGILRTEGCEIPGYNGPSLNTLTSFTVVSQ